MSTLLIGCGNTRERRFALDGVHTFTDELTTLDIDPDVECDVHWDLNERPLPFEDNMFDEIHAYEVLEHLGAQGDYEDFFDLFSELWRITKPGGLLCATVPHWQSQWAWGDPGHRRVIADGTLVFLSQAEYEKQVGDTPMTDYRAIYKADWLTEHMELAGETFAFALKAVK